MLIFSGVHLGSINLVISVWNSDIAPYSLHIVEEQTEGSRVTQCRSNLAMLSAILDVCFMAQCRERTASFSIARENFTISHGSISIYGQCKKSANFHATLMTTFFSTNLCGLGSERQKQHTVADFLTMLSYQKHWSKQSHTYHPKMVQRVQKTGRNIREILQSFLEALDQS